MSKIAVDIALLPSQEVTNQAIQANRQLTGPAAKEITLNKENCLPHISLAMGCIESDKIEEIGDILQDIAKQYWPDMLTVTGIYIGINEIGMELSLYYIQKTTKLQLLHEKVMTQLQSFFTYDVAPDMLIGAPEIAQSTLDWIKNFPENSSFQNYLPHITIGFGRIPPLDSPLTFTPQGLAMCQLGNHCTCKKILKRTKPKI